MAKQRNQPGEDQFTLVGEQGKSRPKRPLAGWPVQVGDLLVLSAAYTGSFLLSGLQSGLSGRNKVWMVATALLCLVIWWLVLVWSEIYPKRQRRSNLDYVLRCVIGLNVCALVAVLGRVIAGTTAGAALHELSGLWLPVAAFWAMSLAGMGAVRLAALAWAGRVRPRTRTCRNFIVIGSGTKARRVAKDRLADRGQESRLLGYVDSEPHRGFIPEAMLLGRINELERILTEKDVDEVLIALPMKNKYEDIGKVIATCQKMGVQSHYFSEPAGTASSND